MEVFLSLWNWLANMSPVLPSLVLLRIAYPLAWGIVAAWAVAECTKKFRRPVRLALVALTLVAAWWPGSWSLPYGLGMAFQLPSWTALLLCLMGLYRNLWAGELSGPMVAAISADPDAAAQRPAGPDWFVYAGLLLGLVLLLDTFILLPFALYRWGFSLFALVLVLLVVVGVWAMSNPGSKARDRSGLLLLVLALYIVTRLPSGNVFDALIDPWLWLVVFGNRVRWGAQNLKALLRRPPQSTPG